MSYATRDEVFLLGLSAQAFVTRPRPLEAYDASNVAISTGTIRLTGHGFSTADLVYLTVTAGGALPGGTAPLTYYSPLPLGNDLFQLAATPYGSPIVFSSIGFGWSLAVDPMRRIDLHREERSGFIDEHLTAHEPPILPNPVTGKYPIVLVGLCARMTARAAVTSLQIENAAYRVAIDRLMAMAAADGDTNPPAQPGSLLGDWKAGKPVQPRPKDQNTVPDNSAVAFSLRAVPWQTGYI
jgi:hypothetical protein